MAPQIYFNPSCSKCRSALSLLERARRRRRRRFAISISRRPVPTSSASCDLLGIDDPRRMMRTGESVYADLGLADRAGDDLLDAITGHPILLERPIFVAGDRAVIARPPERVLELL